MALLIGVFCFVGMGRVLISLGADVMSWQYWSMVMIMFIYGLVNRLDS